MTKQTRRWRIGPLAALSTAALLASACSRGESISKPGEAHVAVLTSALSQADITRITLTISGNSVSVPIVADLTRAPGGAAWAAEVPEVPAGQQRFEAAAFGGADGGALYQGSTDATIVAGARAQVVSSFRRALRRLRSRASRPPSTR
jgi:hypothetical protein